MNTETPHVTIYSTPTCHFCHLAKDFFNAHNIPFTDHNVMDDMQQRNIMMEKTNQMGVPVIEIGDEIIIGFNEGKIKELLNI